MPLLYAMWHGNETQKALIKEAIKTGNGMRHLKEILAAINETGALEYTKQQARKAESQALAALATIPESPYKDALKGLVHIAVERVA